MGCEQPHNPLSILDPIPIGRRVTPFSGEPPKRLRVGFLRPDPTNLIRLVPA
jgi:hypothetical protein